jgi:hypothetical protein
LDGKLGRLSSKFAVGSNNSVIKKIDLQAPHIMLLHVNCSIILTFLVIPGRRMSSIQLPPMVNSAVESSKNYAAENPLTALTVLALVITCAIPVIVFLSFALITLFVTFAGFLFVEGEPYIQFNYNKMYSQ